VIDLAHAVHPPVEHRVERLVPLDRLQHEPRHELQRDLHEHAERPQPQPHRGQQVGSLGLAHAQQLAGARDERGRDHLGREPTEREPGAVRARRDRARDRLPVDVAHVRHREAVRLEQAREPVEGRARTERDPAGRGIRVDHAREVGDVELHIARHGDAREAVPRPDGLDAQAGCRGGLHRALHRARVGGPLDPQRPNRLGPCPVAPHRTRRRHRNAFPSPRYVGTVPTTVSPSTTANPSRCSASSPDFA
jgi:hypothetical protein